jgi:polysaccharide deacetylase family protein (PEP-CTERM system associated)
MDIGTGGPNHLLSFDVEEYFHAEAAQRCGIAAADWPTIPRRLAPAVEKILELLSGRGLAATFFILGWVARNDAALVRRIADQGHEIASHGMSHQMLHRLDAAALAGELRDSRALLEDISSSPVTGFRAPTFSITRRTAWALDVLAECGYRYDSSIFPVRHDRYGVPDAPPGPHLARGPGGGTILELPPLTRRLAGMNLPLAGGGYLRLLPVRWVASALRAAQRHRRPGAIYLHPWELDPEHPVLPMKRFQRWRHRVNLHRTADKLCWLLDRFDFGPMDRCAAEMDRDSLATFDYALPRSSARRGR